MAKWRHPSTVSFHASESWAGNLDGSSCLDAREWKEAQKERPRQRAGALTILLEERLEASRAARPAEPRAPCAPAPGTSGGARLESTVLAQPSPFGGGIRPSARYSTRRYEPLAPISRRQAQALPVLIVDGRRPRVRLKNEQHLWDTQDFAAKDAAWVHAGQAASAGGCPAANTGLDIGHAMDVASDCAARAPWQQMKQDDGRSAAGGGNSTQMAYAAAGITVSGNQYRCGENLDSGQRKKVRGTHIFAQTHSGVETDLHGAACTVLMRARCEAVEMREAPVLDTSLTTPRILSLRAGSAPAFGSRIILEQAARSTTGADLISTAARILSLRAGSATAFGSRIILAQAAQYTTGAVSILHNSLQESIQFHSAAQLQGLTSYCPPGSTFESIRSHSAAQLQGLIFHCSIGSTIGRLHCPIRFRRMPAKKGGAAGRHRAVTDDVGSTAKFNAAIADALKAKKSQQPLVERQRELELQEKAAQQKRMETQHAKARQDREFHDSVTTIVDEVHRLRVEQREQGTEIPMNAISAMLKGTVGMSQDVIQAALFAVFQVAQEEREGLSRASIKTAQILLGMADTALRLTIRREQGLQKYQAQALLRDIANGDADVFVLGASSPTNSAPTLNEAMITLRNPNLPALRGTLVTSTHVTVGLERYGAKLFNRATEVLIMISPEHKQVGAVLFQTLQALDLNLSQIEHFLTQQLRANITDTAVGEDLLYVRIDPSTQSESGVMAAPLDKLGGPPYSGSSRMFAGLQARGKQRVQEKGASGVVQININMEGVTSPGLQVLFTLVGATPRSIPTSREEAFSEIRQELKNGRERQRKAVKSLVEVLDNLLESSAENTAVASILMPLLVQLEGAAKAKVQQEVDEMLQETSPAAADKLGALKLLKGLKAKADELDRMDLNNEWQAEDGRWQLVWAQPRDGDAFQQAIGSETRRRGRGARSDPQQWIAAARSLLAEKWNIRIIGLSIIADEKGYMVPRKGVAILYEPNPGEDVKALARRIKLPESLAAHLHIQGESGGAIPTSMLLSNWFNEHPFDGVWMVYYIGDEKVTGQMRMSELKGQNPGRLGPHDIREFGTTLGLSDSANETLPAALHEMCLSGRLRLVPVTRDFGIYFQSSLARYLTDSAAVSMLRDIDAGSSVEFVVRGILDTALLRHVWRASMAGVFLPGQAHVVNVQEAPISSAGEEMMPAPKVLEGPRCLDAITSRHTLFQITGVNQQQMLEEAIGHLLHSREVEAIAAGDHTLLLPAGHNIAAPVNSQVVVPGAEIHWDALEFTPEGQQEMTEKLHVFLQQHGLLYLPGEEEIQRWLSGGRTAPQSLGASVEWHRLAGKTHGFHEMTGDSWLVERLKQAEQEGLQRYVVPPAEWSASGSPYLPLGMCIELETGSTWMHVVLYSIQELLLEHMHLAAVALVRKIIGGLHSADQVRLVSVPGGQLIVAARQEGLVSKRLRTIKDNFPDDRVTQIALRRALVGSGSGTGIPIQAQEVLPNPNRAESIRAGLDALKQAQEKKANEWLTHLEEKRPIFIADGPDARRIFFQMTEEDESRPTSLSFAEPFSLLSELLEADMDAESSDGQWKIKTLNGTIYLKEPMETAACAEWGNQRVEIRKMSELQRMLLGKRAAEDRQSMSVSEQRETLSDSPVEQGEGGAGQAKRRANTNK